MGLHGKIYILKVSTHIGAIYFHQPLAEAFALEWNWRDWGDGGTMTGASVTLLCCLFKEPAWGGFFKKPECEALKNELKYSIKTQQLHKNSY